MDKRFFLQFVLTLAVIMVGTSAVLPQRYELTFPRDPGPELTQQVRTDHLRYIEENKPQIVLLGDSTLVLGVDANSLAEQTDKSIYSIGIPGSASALWYLLIKNNIAESTHKPEYVLVVFRDTILTAPGYRVHGSYFDLVSEYARRKEPLFIQNSFVNLMNPLEVAAEKYFPLYVTRSEIRNGIDRKIRYFVPPLFGCDVKCTDVALGEIFAGADLEPGALVDALGSAESLLYSDEQLDFESQVDVSYLPEMIRIANESGTQIVFVRIKVETSRSGPELDVYLNSLRTYLKENNVPLIDLGDDPRFSHELFRDPIHLNERGKILFTQLVADEMKELIKDK